jgi:hypothetical protein
VRQAVLQRFNDEVGRNSRAQDLLKDLLKVVPFAAAKCRCLPFPSCLVTIRHCDKRLISLVLFEV